MSDTPKEFGPIATEVLYEDEQIRIWDQRLASGQQTAPHRHDNDYVLVDVEGERIGVEPLPGHNNRDFDAYLELPVRRGQVYFIEKGSVERAENIGGAPYRGVLIEFKR
jgi:hypothetical protein